MRTVNREKLTPREKAERGMALNIGELSAATGYSRSALQKLGIRQRNLPGGKMRLDDFWEYVKKLQSQKLESPSAQMTPAVVATSRAASSNQQEIMKLADALMAPRKPNARH